MSEAREARLQSLRPHVVVDFWPLGPSYPVIRLTNAGMGVALDVDLRGTLPPTPRDDGSGEPEPFTFIFRWPAMPVGANHQISPPDKLPGSTRSSLDRMREDYGPLTVQGTCRDILGRQHEVSITIDFREWWDAIETRHELSNPAPTEQSAQQLRSIGQKLDNLIKKLG